jgi:hypothetical protein
VGRAERQARWRASTPYRRLEVLLSPEALARLDERVAARGSSRGALLEVLILESLPPRLPDDTPQRLVEGYTHLLRAAQRQPLGAMAVRSILRPVLVGLGLKEVP